MSEAAPQLGYAFVGSGLHTAFRKGLDGPASSVLYNVVHLLPEEDWEAFARDVSDAVARAGRFDAETLRLACVDHEFRDGKRDAPASGKVRSLRNVLSAGLRCLGTFDWVALARFLREGDPDLSAERNVDGGSVAEAGWRKDLRVEVTLVGGDGATLASLVPGRDGRVACTLVGGDVEWLDGMTLDQAVAHAKDGVRRLAFAGREARVDRARVEAARSVSFAPALDPADPFEAMLAAAGAKGTVILRRPTRLPDEGVGLTAYVFDADLAEVFSWHVAERREAGRTWTTLGPNARERLSRTATSRSRDTVDDDLVVATIEIRKDGEGGALARGALLYAGDDPASTLAQGDWVAIPGFASPRPDGFGDAKPPAP